MAGPSICLSPAKKTNNRRQKMDISSSPKQQQQQQQHRNPRSSGSMMMQPQSRKDLLTQLRSGVKVKDRRYRLRVYKQCFIGRDLVDHMMTSGMVKTREEAIIQGQKYQKDYQLFAHVCDDHEFEDGYLFYRFIDCCDDSYSSTTKSDRSHSVNGGDAVDDMTETSDFHLDSSHRSTNSATQTGIDNAVDPHLRPSMTNCQNKIGLKSVGKILKHDVQLTYNYKLDQQCFKAHDLVDFMVTEGLASNRQDAVQIGLALQREELIQSIDVQGPFRFKDARLYFRFASTSSTTSHHPTNVNSQWETELTKISQLLTSNIQVQNETYHLKVYENCFIGKVAVSTIVNDLALTTSRRDAVLLGRAIMHEHQLFEHVTYDHVFEDEEYFYKFTRQSDEQTKILKTYRQRRVQNSRRGSSTKDIYDIDYEDDDSDNDNDDGDSD